MKLRLLNNEYYLYEYRLAKKGDICLQTEFAHDCWWAHSDKDPGSGMYNVVIATTRDISELTGDNIYKLKWTPYVYDELSTPKFTFDALVKAYRQGSFDGDAMARTLHKDIKSYVSVEHYMSSLAQSEWDVEIETEEHYNMVGGLLNIEDFGGVGNQVQYYYTPKITDGYITIIKINERNIN